MAGKKLYGKEYFAAALAKEYGISQEKAAGIMRFICDEVTNALVEGKLVKLGQLGTLRLKERPARTGTDPRTGVSIEIPKNYAIKANISSTLRESLRRRDDGC